MRFPFVLKRTYERERKDRLKWQGESVRLSRLAEDAEGHLFRLMNSVQPLLDAVQRVKDTSESVLED